MTVPGPEADLTAPKSDFRFTPESGLRSDIPRRPFRARNRYGFSCSQPVGASTTDEDNVHPSHSCAVTASSYHWDGRCGSEMELCAMRLPIGSSVADRRSKGGSVAFVVLAVRPRCGIWAFIRRAPTPLASIARPGFHLSTRNRS